MTTFLSADATLLEALRLCSIEDDDAEPYKSRYAAADLLKAAAQKIEAELLSTTPDVPSEASSGSVPTSSRTLTEPADLNKREALQQHVAALRAQRGLALVQTDLLADADADMNAVLPFLEREPLRQPALLLEMYNALGSLASNRGVHDLAITWLSKAEALYHLQQRSSSKTSASITSLNAAVSSDVAPHGTPIEAPSSVAGLEALHTSTLFFLAQVHGHAGQRDKSAGYCAATLHRQLISGQYQPREWAPNCLALAAYFISVRAFAPAQYCLTAASKVAESLSEAVGSSDANAGGESSDADLPANIQLAWARLYLARLVASHEKVVDRVELDGQAEEPPSTSELHFSSLDIPLLESCPAGPAALAANFDDARTLFNLALPRFKAGLGYFKLDGWVTEHCNILMEVSNLYRCLAGFEPDPHRACVMHKHRARNLEPLSGQLNPEFYLGLARSIDLELGNIYRELLEIKENDGRPGAKAFIDTYRLPNGQLPDKMEDEDGQRYLLRASFSMGRVLHKCNGSGAEGGTTAMMQAAHKHLMWASDYVLRNNVMEFSPEARMASELATLVAEKIDLMSRVQSMRQPRGAVP